ncbi:MAG TPA: histidine kinase dimerization/phospho-acceptor domain-containing protein [Acidimicrobiales bacterium]|nr:histidine kinase dimerization/phospho-acceptor domain-containing protein [Acidimicrobiales bacterium]
MKIRLRIALLLAASFLTAGAVTLAIGAVTYQRAVYRSPGEITDELLVELGVSRELATEYIRAHPETVVSPPAGEGPERRLDSAINKAFQRVQRRSADAAADRARLWSMAALAGMAAVAALAGWMIAGRAMRPLRTMTARARAASGTDLSGRVGLEGPHDEIRELGDTFDAMLDRLERAFLAQRRFSTQVSHEIRTPLSIISSETDLLLRDAPSTQERDALQQIRVATQRAERIVGALLVLARSGSGDLQSDDLRLDLVAGDVLGDVVNGPEWRVVRVDLHLDAAPVRGDRALLERLVANLLSNAVRHNRGEGGWVEMRTRALGDWSILEIENSVPVADEDRPEAATSGVPSNGVGLTVVDSVLAAHGGDLAWDRTVPGVVTVTVRLPAAPLPEPVG